MKNQELFDKTVAILVKAYFNNTLQATDCNACAIGNLVAGNLGLKLQNTDMGLRCEGYEYSNPLKDTGFWYKYIANGFIYNEHDPLLQLQLSTIGYSALDTANIEHRFMEGISASRRSKKKDSQDENFIGLMEVVDCLSEIHEATKEEAQQAKELFTHA